MMAISGKFIVTFRILFYNNLKEKCQVLGLNNVHPLKNCSKRGGILTKLQELQKNFKNYAEFPKLLFFYIYSIYENDIITEVS